MSLWTGLALMFGARGGIERGDSGELHELCVAGEALHAGDLGDELGGGQRPAAGQV